MKLNKFEYKGWLMALMILLNHWDFLRRSPGNQDLFFVIIDLIILVLITIIVVFCYSYFLKRYRLNMVLDIILSLIVMLITTYFSVCLMAYINPVFITVVYTFESYVGLSVIIWWLCLIPIYILLRILLVLSSLMMVDKH
jgi:hypothetical protein